jgi:hypothetical protein
MLIILARILEMPKEGEAREGNGEEEGDNVPSATR